MEHALILTSSGIDSREIKDALLRSLTEVKRPVFALVPNACDLERALGYTKLCMKELTLLGIEAVEVDLRKTKGKKLKEALRKKDGIYVMGGNTYYLREKMAKSGFDALLPLLLDEGKVYVGASAGSIVVGPDIRMARDPRVVKLKSFNGIGAVSFVVLPHYFDKEGIGLEGRGFVELARKELAPNPVIPVSNGQAIVVNGTKTRLVGQTQISTFISRPSERGQDTKELEEQLIRLDFKRQVDPKMNKLCFSA
jgi:dipeptidase E